MMCEACEQLADHFVCILKDVNSHWTVCIRCYEDDTWPTVIRTKAQLTEREHNDRKEQAIDPWEKLGI